jgi:hypothetical protein
MLSVLPRSSAFETARDLAYLRAEAPYLFGRLGDVLGVDLDLRSLDLRPVHHRLAEPTLLPLLGGGESEAPGSSGKGSPAGDERDFRFACSFAYGFAGALRLTADVVEALLTASTFELFPADPFERDLPLLAPLLELRDLLPADFDLVDLGFEAFDFGFDDDFALFGADRFVLVFVWAIVPLLELFPDLVPDWWS